MPTQTLNRPSAVSSPPYDSKFETRAGHERHLARQLNIANSKRPMGITIDHVQNQDKPMSDARYRELMGCTAEGAATLAREDAKKKTAVATNSASDRPNTRQSRAEWLASLTPRQRELVEAGGG